MSKRMTVNIKYNKPIGLDEYEETLEVRDIGFTHGFLILEISDSRTIYVNSNNINQIISDKGSDEE